MSSTAKKQQSFLHGSIILIIATVLAKVIGAVYRIPLTNLLGADGMGYYTTAYDLYVPMYSIAMAGLPIAISRIIAENTAKNRYKDVSRTLHAAQIIFLITGSIGFILLVALAFVLTGHMSINLFGWCPDLAVFNKDTLVCILAIAPSLLLCCLMSAYRGYFEGLGNMTPTGISEILEATGKLLFGYTFAFLIVKTTGNYYYAAAGALVGISIGELLSTVYLFIRYKTTKWKYISREDYDAAPEPKNLKKCFSAIIIIAIPIVLGSLVNNITSLVDVAMVQKQLANAISKAPDYFQNHYSAFIASLVEKNAKNGEVFDWLKDLPVSLYGCHRGFAFSIYNLIPVLTSTLGVSAIPVLAKAWTKNDRESVRTNIQTMLRTVAVMAIPCGAGIFAISKPILSLLYSDKTAIDIAAPNLAILGICAVFAGINAPLVNMLQAIGKERVPLVNIAVGAMLKIIFNFILVGIPEINIIGVPIGTTICYGYICIANLICIIKYSKVKIDFVSTLLKPFIAGSGCGAMAFASYFVFGYILHGKLLTVLSILAAGIFYIVLLALLKVIEEQDVLSLPMGEKMLKILKIVKIVR